MSIFLPKGIRSGGVIDPSELGDEFVRANSIATDTTQYQWTKDTFSDSTNSKINMLKPGTAVKIHQVTQSAYLRGTATATSVPSAARTDYNADPGNDPILTVAGGDQNLYHIPYNSGFATITGKSDDSSDMSISWTNQYPELVMAAFSFQFARKFTYLVYPGVYAAPALQVRISLNGGTIAGAGIYNTAEPSQAERGLGLVRRMARQTIVGMTMVPAGSHILTAEAAQPPIEPVSFGAFGEGSSYSFETPPDEGVCIAHRKLILIRFPRAGWGGG
mgnify:CR=1 FL=1